MEGEEIIVYNPFLFDESYWTYRKLQKLCLKLSLSGKGTRNELENRLKEWNKQRDYNNFEENYPMNVTGNNFTLLSINIQESKKKKKKVREKNEKRKKKRKRLSFNEEKNDVITVDPILIRPIQRNNNNCLISTVSLDDNTNNTNNNNSIYTTPTKGILKKSNPSEFSLTDNESETSDNHPFKMNKLQFSPFNGVKIISHRYSLHSLSSSSYPPI